MADAGTSAGRDPYPSGRSVWSGRKRYRDFIGCVDGGCKGNGRRQSGRISGRLEICSGRNVSRRSG
ncbi:hypothetical protein DXA08_17480 [Blautia obeum]|nr:hypothetical protein DXA08_17480 [Blautia obeum]